MAEMVLSTNYKTAVDLDQRIKTTAKALAENLFELCGMFYKMSSEKLYKELGYQNFAEYCESEVGIHRHQGMKYANIGKSFQNVESTQHFETLGTEKLYLLAKLDEPEREEIRQNVHVEDVSVRELKTRIDKLKSEKKNAESDLQSLQAKLDKANKKINDLENRPVEVAIQEDEASKQKIRNLEDKLLETTAQKSQAMNQKQALQKQISDMEKQLADLKNVNQLQEIRLQNPDKIVDTREVFKAYQKSIVNSMNSMLMFLQTESNHQVFVDKLRETISAFELKINSLQKGSQ